MVFVRDRASASGGIFCLDTPIEAVIVILISLVVLALSIWKLELGLLVAFTELMVGSHGHLFSFDSIFGMLKLLIRLFTFSIKLNSRNELI